MPGNLVGVALEKNGEDGSMPNKELPNARKTYSQPNISVHGDVRLVTRNIQMGMGGGDGMGQGNQEFKTS